MSEDNAKEPADKSRRAVILASVGIVVIMSLALFIGTIVAPLWQTHVVVRESKDRFHVTRAPEDDTAIAYDLLDRLGGTERTARRLRTYLRLPRWVKADRHGAIYLLYYCGPLATPALEEALSNVDASVRRSAAIALGKIGPEAKEAVPALVKVLEGPDSALRYYVGWALGEIGPEAKAAVPALTKALGDTDDTVRWRAAWALGEIGPKAKAAVPALEKLSADADFEVRRAGAEALKKIRTPAPTPDAPEEVPAEGE